MLRWKTWLRNVAGKYNQIDPIHIYIYIYWKQRLLGNVKIEYRNNFY
jgi:hypothetical protein